MNEASSTLDTLGMIDVATIMLGESVVREEEAFAALFVATDVECAVSDISYGLLKLDVERKRYLV